MVNKFTNAWTEDEDKILHDCIGKNLSARQITAYLKRSRNAIIGRCARMGYRLAGVKPKRGEAAAPKPRTQKRLSELEQAKLRDLTQIQTASEKFAPMQEGALWRIPKAGNCKYPYGDPSGENYRLCGHKAEQGKSYCAHHLKLTSAPAWTRAKIGWQ